MGFFHRFVNTPEKLVKFRRNYAIPDDVVLELAPEDGNFAGRDVADLRIPLVHIIEGELDFLWILSSGTSTPIFSWSLAWFRPTWLGSS